MESAFHWTLSRIAVSVQRVTAGPCVTNKGSCLTPAVDCPASMAAARSQTQETLSVTVKAATLGSFVMQVGLENFESVMWLEKYNNLSWCFVLVFQSLSAEGNLCEIFTKYSEDTLSARQHVWFLGWNALGFVTQVPAVPAREWNAGNIPLNAVMEPPSARKWKRPSSVAAWAACSIIHSITATATEQKMERKRGRKEEREKTEQRRSKVREGKKERKRLLRVYIKPLSIYYGQQCL